MSQSRGTYWTNHPWTLYFPDGRTVTGYGTQTSNMSDRNGNTITVQNIDPNVAGQNPVNVLTDALGRTITMQHQLSNSTVVQDTITRSGYNGQALTWYVNWTSVVLNGSLNYYCTGQNDICPGNMVQRVVSSITLPTPQDGSLLTYSFGYDGSNIGGWGELNQVTLPGVGSYPGASVHYNYSQENQWKTILGYLPESPVSTKTVSWKDDADGIQRTDTWQYSFASTQSQITNPDGGVARSYFYDPHAYSDPNRGLVFKTVQPNSDTVERAWQHNRPYGAQGIDPANPYVKSEYRSVSTSGSPVQASVKTFTNDKNGNATLTWETDWIPYSSVGHNVYGAPNPYSNAGVRSTTNTYSVLVSNAGDGTESIIDEVNGYWHAGSPLFRNLPARRVTSGLGAGAVSESSYDAHGNVSQERQWDSTKAAGQPASLNTSNSVIVYRTYDGYGNPSTVTNGRGYLINLSYDSNNLYVSQKVQAYGTSDSRTFNYGHDFYSGLVTSETDSDHTAWSRTLNYDKFGRNTLVTESGMRTTATTYNDGLRQILVKSDLNTVNDQALVRATWFDALGRVRLTKQLEQAGNDVNNAFYGIKALTRYYTPPSSGTSYQLVSNPYVSGNEQSMGWTRTKFDTNGRPVQVVHFNGPASSLPYPWGGSSSDTGTGAATAAYASYSVTVTDETGVARTTTVDGLGRMNQVSENGIGATTIYSYDALDNLTGVTPASGSSRAFNYSSRKLLTSAFNPESGTTSYTYDNNGNLQMRTDNRGIAASYTYNGLDQISGKTYSDYSTSYPTPWVSYGYNKGWLTSVSGSSVYQYTGFDGLGRVTSGTQTANSQAYPFQVQYNLANGVKSLTYPSGRVVTTSYDGAGRELSVTGTNQNGIAVGYVAAPRMRRTER